MAVAGAETVEVATNHGGSMVAGIVLLVFALAVVVIGIGSQKFDWIDGDTKEFIVYGCFLAAGIAALAGVVMLGAHMQQTLK